MKPSILVSIIFITLSVYFTDALKAQGSLYVSKQTGESSKLTGNYSKQTDKHSSGNANFTKSGPINYTVSQAFTIAPNENKTWEGSITVNISEAPAPGNSATAEISMNGDVKYSRPYGVGTDGEVESTYYCSSNGSASGEGGCSYHQNQPGAHEIVRKTGNTSVPLTVYSILVDIPDTICLSTGGTKTVTANAFPSGVGSFQWTSNNSNVNFANANSATATITLSDTTITNATVKVKFTIEGVNYEKTAVLSTGCDCNCKPITAPIDAGPLHITLSANPTSTNPDSNGDCEYSTNNAGANITVDATGFNRAFNIENGASVSFKKNCETGKISNVAFNWSGNIEVAEISIRGVKVFKPTIKAVNIQVNDEGYVSGTVTVNVANTEDRDLSFNKKFVLLRKGTNSDLTFTFSGGNNWSGTMGWSGIQGLVIDLCKQSDGAEVKLANFTGGLGSDGSLTGNFSVTGQPSYKSNLFKVTLKSLTLGCELKVTDGSFRLTSGSGTVSISEMKAVTGSVDLSLNLPEDGGCEASIAASDIKAFSMTLDELNIQANFNRDFEITEISGSLKAKHNQFDVKLAVNEFKVENGSLTKFTCAGDVKYKGFSFNLQNGSYANNALSITARAEISATGTAAMLAVDKFEVKEDGAISIGKIEGSLNRAPATVSFSATFGDSRFTGTFNGEFAGIGLDGTVDIGAMETPAYNFAYLGITAKVNVPLGQSGLKLTQIGGMLGYNYQLGAPNAATGTYPSPPGTPTQGRYLAGLKLGVADIGNMCEVVGSTVIAFGNGNIDIGLSGTIAILKNNAFFQGGANVNYSIPSQTISGNVGAAFKIPSSGFILSTGNPNPNIQFFLGNDGGSKKFRASSNAMSGSMFGGKIQLSNGNFSLNGSLDDITSLTGSLGGKASASFSFNPSFSALGATISGTLNMNMNSNINAAFDQNGLSGGFGVHVDGNGSMTFDPPLGWAITVGGSATCDGTVNYSAGSLALTGNVSITLPNIPFYGDLTVSTGEISISI